MRIAVVGSGIAGLASAWLLSREHEVTLFEANSYLGGHTHTHDVQLRGREYRVDSGFIVHNPAHYPLLTRTVRRSSASASQPTTMSFSVHSEATGLEYNAATLDTLFCQRRNLLSPRFLGMVRDLIALLSRGAGAAATTDDEGPTLGDYLRRSTATARRFATNTWCRWPRRCGHRRRRRSSRFPARYLVQFMANHQMLQISDRPQWRVVQGGSVDLCRCAARNAGRCTSACTARCARCAATAIGVEVDSAAGIEHFDQVVLACHSDQALALLADADAREQSILGAMPYQANDTVLHTDAALLPRQRKAWAAWNAWLPRNPDEACTVSYCMNLLQGIESPEPFVVTLNRTRRHRPGQGAGAHALPPSGVQPRLGGRAGAQGRDPGPAAHLVRRRLLGLGLPRGRHAQRGGGGRGTGRAAGRLGRSPIALTRRREERRGMTVKPHAAKPPLASAVYEGVVRHRRHAPHAHAFDYRMAQLYLDLDELDQLFAGAGCGRAARRNLAEFRRSDYLGPGRRCRWPTRCADGSSRPPASARRSDPPADPSALRRLVFNPVSFYYCFADDGADAECIVAEITNTPWKERHAYVLPIEHGADRTGARCTGRFPRPSTCRRSCRWTANTTGASPCPATTCMCTWMCMRDGEREFDATLILHRRPLTGASLARVLWRYPLMTAQVVGAIHWQALRLWLKRNPVHDHPAAC